MATRQVDTANPGGGVFASLSAAIADLPTTFTEDEIIECSASGGAADTTLVSIPNTIVTGAFRLTIRPASGQEHGGVWSDSIYRLDLNASGGSGVTVGALNVTLQGLQIQVRSNSSSRRDAIEDAYGGGSTPNRIYEGCLIRRSAAITGTGLMNAIYSVHSSNANCYRNNIIYDFTATGHAGIWVQQGTAYVYNNTVVDCDVGIHRQSGTLVAINNIAQGGTTNFSGTFDAASDYNVSEDATAPGANSTQNTAVTFADEAGDDFHLASTLPGTDLSAASNFPFSTDIDGDTRSAWDVGADEYSAGGGGDETASLTGAATGASSDSATAVLEVSITGTASGASDDAGTATLTYSVMGTVTLDSEPVEGALVYLIDQSADEVVATETTDASGEYEFADVAAGTYHAVCEYAEHAAPSVSGIVVG